MISMKNDKIIASWSKIEPGDSANDRMLSAILERNRSVRSKKDKVNSMPQKGTKRRLVIAAIGAACLLVLITAGAIYGVNAGWFGSKDYTVRLANGDLIVYHTGSTSEASFHADFPVSFRELTDEETDVLFPTTSKPRRATGTFRDETGELLRLEGEIGGAKVIYASEGFPVSDVVIFGNESSSSVNKIPVTTGYFITKADSKGNKTAIFFGTFTLGGTNIYVECSGDKNDADDVSRVTSDLILNIIENGEPDFGAIKK